MIAGIEIANSVILGNCKMRRFKTSSKKMNDDKTETTIEIARNANTLPGLTYCSAKKSMTNMEAQLPTVANATK